MKRKSVLILATLMSISLCACGGTATSSNSKEQTGKPKAEAENNFSEIEQTLIGQWGYAVEETLSLEARYYEFREDGHGTLVVYDIHSGSADCRFYWNFDYEIIENKIICTMEKMEDGDISTQDISYTFENNNLVLTKSHYGISSGVQLYKDDWYTIVDELREDGERALKSNYTNYLYIE